MQDILVFLALLRHVIILLNAFSKHSIKCQNTLLAIVQTFSVLLDNCFGALWWLLQELHIFVVIEMVMPLFRTVCIWTWYCDVLVFSQIFLRYRSRRIVPHDIRLALVFNFVFRFAVVYSPMRSASCLCMALRALGLFQLWFACLVYQPAPEYGRLGF